ncbi:DNA-3-methyladenine glycosylase [bacterium]|jgi:DNA-3-methyladenine glycosylase|nr:DNA-3-methyladenine glycosylase [bacterium]MBT5015243.1 DNA-3-methyladenine glycosylase [bacterium]
MIILQRNFYERSSPVVARDLLGKILVRVIDGQVVSGIITETEAYGADNDRASHAYRGKTNRNAPMFEMVGHSYVYMSYGLHFCINIVAHTVTEKAGAVLIRALKPLDGIDFMRFKRNFIKDKLLTDGPGKLSQALSIDLGLNKHDVTEEGKLYILDGQSESKIVATPRIGISQEQDLAWRFVITV